MDLAYIEQMKTQLTIILHFLQPLVCCSDILIEIFCEETKSVMIT